MKGKTMAKIRTQSEVARVLGISRQAVSRLIKNRERTGIPMHTDLAGIYFVSEEVADWYRSFDPKCGPRAGLRAG